MYSGDEKFGINLDQRGRSNEEVKTVNLAQLIFSFEVLRRDSSIITPFSHPAPRSRRAHESLDYRCLSECFRREK